MKNALYQLCVLMALLFYGVPSVCADPITFHLLKPWDDPISGHGRGPVLLPDIPIEDYTLFINDEMESDIALIPEGEDEVCYTVHVAAGTTEIYLPLNFSGTYTILLYRGTLTFEGEIGLPSEKEKQ